MNRPRVDFIDTSVFCHIIAVPGRTTPEETAEFTAEFARRRDDEGMRFVLPITTIIETGNFIQQCATGRREAAERFRTALELAAQDDAPWVVHDLDWNGEFIREVVAGNGTGASLVEHFTAQTLGAGDLTILVERDRYLKKRSFASVGIWTTDAKFQSYLPR
ncbi:hypothetical protein [Mycolicibacterium houstonense]|uniref:hypothetical protein n=1 Tax=Mycolicibacterium houstonense TaxID=146021 RepID=UPI003F978B34